MGGIVGEDIVGEGTVAEDIAGIGAGIVEDIAGDTVEGIAAFEVAAFGVAGLD